MDVGSPGETALRDQVSTRGRREGTARADPIPQADVEGCGGCQAHGSVVHRTERDIGPWSRPQWRGSRFGIYALPAGPAARPPTGPAARPSGPPARPPAAVPAGPV